MTRRIRSHLTLALLAASAIGITVAVTATAALAANGMNACGCREGAPGQCVCEKKSRCGCPGECEPKGCEEKRTKQMEKEIQAETKKAEDAQRRQRVRQDDSDESPARGSGSPSDRERGADREAPAKSPTPARVKIVKMTPAQKRDLARLISAYLAEHPDQSGRTIDQVQSQVQSQLQSEVRQK
jgi:hypothetical protein